MSDLEVFEVAVKRAEDSDKIGEAAVLPIRLVNDDGEEIETRKVTFNAPNSSQAALITMHLGFGGRRKIGNILELMGLIMNLIEDEDDADWIRWNLADPTSPLTIEEFTKMLERVVEAWYARPTEGPSGSSASQPTTGPKSTASRHRKASTHSKTSSPTDS